MVKKDPVPTSSSSSNRSAPTVNFDSYKIVGRGGGGAHRRFVNEIDLSTRDSNKQRQHTRSSAAAIVSHNRTLDVSPVGKGQRRRVVAAVLRLGIRHCARSVPRYVRSGCLTLNSSVDCLQQQSRADTNSYLS